MEVKEIDPFKEDVLNRLKELELRVEGLEKFKQDIYYSIMRSRI